MTISTILLLAYYSLLLLTNIAAVSYIILSGNKDRKKNIEEYKKLNESLEKEYRKAISETHEVRDQYIKRLHALEKRIFYSNN